MRVVATLAVGLLIALSTDATALVLCQKKRAVAARESCRSNETPLSLVGLGVPGPPGTMGAQGAGGAAPLQLVDAAGNDVGPLVQVEFFLPLVFDNDAPLYQVLVRRPPFSDGALLGVNVTGRPTGRVFYEYPNCIGTALVRARGLMVALQVIGDTVLTPAGASSATIARSEEVNDSSQGCLAITPRGGCCRSQGGGGAFENAAPVTTLTELGIVPPTHAVAR